MNAILEYLKRRGAPMSPDAEVLPQPGVSPARTSVRRSPESVLPMARELPPQEPVSPSRELPAVPAAPTPEPMGDPDRHAELRSAEARDNRERAMTDARNGFRQATSLITGSHIQPVAAKPSAVEEFLRKRRAAQEDSAAQRQAMIDRRTFKREDAAEARAGEEFGWRRETHPLDVQQKQKALAEPGQRERWTHDSEEARLERESRERSARARGGGLFGGPADDGYAETIADAIAAGHQPPDMRGLYRYGGPVRAILEKKHGFDLATANRDWTATQRHLSTLNGPQQERLRQAVAFTYDSVDIVENLFNEWQRHGSTSGLRLYNRASLAAAKQMPGPAGAAAQALEAQINDLVSELATVYKGGNSSTDESLKLAAQNLSGDWNDETFKKALGLLRQNLKIRRNSILTSTAAGVSPDSPYTPKTAVSEQTGTETEPKVYVLWKGKRKEIPRSKLEEAKALGAQEVK